MGLIKFKYVTTYVYKYVGACNSLKGDRKKVEGIIIEEDRVKIRRVSGCDVNTLTVPIMDALRVKIKRHRFLDVKVIIGEDGRLYLVAQTSGEGKNIG